MDTPAAPVVRQCVLTEKITIRFGARSLGSRQEQRVWINLRGKIWHASDDALGNAIHPSAPTH